MRRTRVLCEVYVTRFRGGVGSLQTGPTECGCAGCIARNADFTVKHFHEQLRRPHGYLLGYTVTRLALQSAVW